MTEKKQENPLSLPKREMSQGEADTYNKSGGMGGKRLDVPTFMRQEQENPKKLPEDTPPPIEKTSKN
jgi:hypothetical protein